MGQHTITDEQRGITSDMSPLTRLYIKIRQWFQPYYRWTCSKKTPDAPQQTRASKNRTASKKKKKPTGAAKPVKGGKKAPSRASKAGIPDFQMVDYPKPLDNVMKFKKLPSPGVAYAYHDNKRHQVIAHLVPGSGYVFRERDDLARGNMKPLIYPVGGHKPFDRTHLLPIGYHGSESDPRLLIGWDSTANRGPFLKFETRQKKRGRPIYWLTDVRRTNAGAIWHFKVYDAVTRNLIDQLDHEMKHKFVWRS